MVPVPAGLAEIIKLYGDPAPYVNNKEEWERQILVTVPLRRPLIWAYDVSRDVTRVRAHKLVAAELADILDECVSNVGRGRCKYGGSYMWRAKRGRAVLSLHAWAVAVDLEPAENPLGKEWRDDGKMLDPKIAEIFSARFWTWGATFKRPDPQHAQRAASY